MFRGLLAWSGKDALKREREKERKRHTDTNYYFFGIDSLQWKFKFHLIMHKSNENVIATLEQEKNSFDRFRNRL